MANNNVVLVILLFLARCTVVCNNSRRFASNERLHQALFSTYNSNVRPLYQPIDVRMKCDLYSIIHLVRIAFKKIVIKNNNIILKTPYFQNEAEEAITLTQWVAMVIHTRA